MQGNWRCSSSLVSKRHIVGLIRLATFQLYLENVGHQSAEGRFYVDVLFGADFDEAPTLFARELCTHVVRNFLVGQVHFITN